MDLRNALTAPPKPLPTWLRHGYLIICVTLLAWNLGWRSLHGWIGGSENLSLVLVALPLNHVAFRYDWPRPVRVILRCAASVWIALTLGHWLSQFRALLGAGNA